MDRTPDFEALTTTRGNPRARQYTPLDETTSLVAKIKKIKLHLLKLGHEYLDTYCDLKGTPRMTDERRQKLDEEVEEFIDNCEEKIKILRSEIQLGTTSEQVIEHRETMIKIVRRILNDLFKYFNHLKTTRIRRNVEKDKYDRIVTLRGSLDPGDEFESINTSNLDIEKLTSLSQEETLGTSLSSMKHSQNNFNATTSNRLDDYSMIEDEHQDISPREMQALVRENSRIHEELITFDDEVRLIGKKVAQISKLQELFTEKVMEQAVDLNNLHETAIRSSENVREGNDLIRDAMMKNASTRVFILFYIITLGFTILFLDWYNP